MVTSEALTQRRQAASRPRRGSIGNRRSEKQAETTTRLKYPNRVVAHRRQVEEYIAAIKSGEIPAGRLVRLAVQRYEEDRERYDFNEKLAVRAINFAKSFCKHSMGEFAGQPFEFQPWQKFITWNLFGFQVDGLRRFRYAFISLGRKNGKSTFIASLATYMQADDMPQEPRAQMCIAATKVEQSCIVYDECDNFVKQDKELSARFLRYQNRLVYAPTDSVLRTISADKPYDGLSPHLVCLDELHAWREVHRKFFNTMKTGGGARRQPLLGVITTAGDDGSSLYNEEVDYAGKILDGIVDDPKMFAYIASLDREDDPFEEANWIKANPNLDVSLKREYLRDQAREAQNKASARNAFLRYHCNTRTTASESVFTRDVWEACIGACVDQPDRVHGGFDLARSKDFAAWAIVRRCGELFEVITRSYTCRERTTDMQVPFIAEWIRAGYLVEHPGDVIDYDEFERDLLEATRVYGVQTWAFDRTFAHQMGQHLVRELGEDVPFEFTQGPAYYNEPFRNFEAAVTCGKVLHDGNPCLAWQATNLMVKRNARDQWMPDKSAVKSKIDAMVAVLMAFSECMFSEAESEWRLEDCGV